MIFHAFQFEARGGKKRVLTEPEQKVATDLAKKVPPTLKSKAIREMGSRIFCVAWAPFPCGRPPRCSSASFGSVRFPGLAPRPLSSSSPP